MYIRKRLHVIIFNIQFFFLTFEIFKTRLQIHISTKYCEYLFFVHLLKIKYVILWTYFEWQIRVFLFLANLKAWQMRVSEG